jgi:MFS family permease
VGYIIISFFSDNWGRKKTTILGWSIAVFGILLVQFAVNIQMAGVGLFFAGLGADSILNITLTIMI